MGLVSCNFCCLFHVEFIKALLNITPCRICLWLAGCLKITSYSEGISMVEKKQKKNEIILLYSLLSVFKLTRGKQKLWNREIPRRARFMFVMPVPGLTDSILFATLLVIPKWFSIKSVMNLLTKLFFIFSVVVYQYYSAINYIITLFSLWTGY